MDRMKRLSWVPDSIIGLIGRKCKPLVEVDFPIAKVPEHMVQEKALRYGVPRTLQPLRIARNLVKTAHGDEPPHRKDN